MVVICEAGQRPLPSQELQRYHRTRCRQAVEVLRYLASIHTYVGILRPQIMFAN